MSNPWISISPWPCDRQEEKGSVGSKAPFRRLSSKAFSIEGSDAAEKSSSLTAAEVVSSLGSLAGGWYWVGIALDGLKKAWI